MSDQKNAIELTESTVNQRIQEILRTSLEDNYDSVAWYVNDNFFTEATAQLTKLLVEARLNELESAVQQFIFNTPGNPHNFSEYATHRIKHLTASKEEQENNT